MKLAFPYREDFVNWEEYIQAIDEYRRYMVKYRP